MDKQVTIQDLQDQLPTQEAELAQTREELIRVKDELAREIAQRRESEEVLRFRAARFRLLVEHSHDVVYAVASDGIVTYISPHFAHYGYSPQRDHPRGHDSGIGSEKARWTHTGLAVLLTPQSTFKGGQY